MFFIQLPLIALGHTQGNGLRPVLKVLTELSSKLSFGLFAMHGVSQDWICLLVLR